VCEPIPTLDAALEALHLLLPAEVETTNA